MPNHIAPLPSTPVRQPGRRPNILMIMVDQMRFPCLDYGPAHGFKEPLKQIFGFQETDENSNDFKRFFPGLWALRDNAVVLRNHRIASSACVPSRTAIFSGQYGTITKATQTDGAFKNGADPAFPWLDPEAFPTIGDWMQANGYTSHYFGKWHVSGEATTDLEGYGFMDWDLSYPDPHGTLPNNLGYYRDYQFEDLTTSFLRRQGLGVPYDIEHAEHNVAEASGEDPGAELDDTPTPWFAVASFTNPHDIGSYPGLPRSVHNSLVNDAPYTLAVPDHRSTGNLPTAGTMAIELNRHDFPQPNANVSPTWNESLDNKPWCQLDYAYKMGLTLMSKAGWSTAMADTSLTTKQAQRDRAVAITLSSNVLGLPLTLTANPKDACRAFMQYYGYLIHEVDQHIHAVLRALEQSGQAENTIVIFAPDHGEYGGAHHMMTEKWHSSYEEFVHVPMVVRFPKSFHRVPGGLRQVDDPTSHIDILPTILGLAGIDGEQRLVTQQALRQTHSKSYMPVGADLSQLLLGREQTIEDPATGQEREGVLFMTHDTISAPLDGDLDATTDIDDPTTELTAYDVYLEVIRQLKLGGDRYPEEVTKLEEGSVREPSLVHSVVSQDRWKLVRYFAPDSAGDIADQYELYDLNTDPNEQYNLLVFNEPFPTVVQLDTLPEEQRHPQFAIADQADTLMTLLTRLENQMLVEPGVAVTKPLLPVRPKPLKRS